MPACFFLLKFPLRENVNCPICRVGESENALYHYKHSGAYADSEDTGQAQALEKQLSRCIETRKLKQWNTLLKNTQRAISSGADSAPQVGSHII